MKFGLIEFPWAILKESGSQKSEVHLMNNTFALLECRLTFQYYQ